MIIGRNFLVKVNANIGNSAVKSSIADEVEKLQWSIRWGADTVMDLSTGKDIHADARVHPAQQPGADRHRADLRGLERVKGRVAKLNIDLFLETSPSRPSRASTTSPIHAGVLLRYVPLTARRVTGIVSRGGSIMAKWCLTITRRTSSTRTSSGSAS
jgi:phosphomethylpyrimidine synthase